MKRILCLWLPDWSVQRLWQQHPPWRGQPLVLYEPQPCGGARVVACSPAARAGGVRVGMPLAEATALAGATANGWKSEPWNSAADRAALEHLARQCERYSPMVGLEEAAVPETIVLDITGLATLLGGEPVLARRLADRFSRRQLIARLAIADTLGAAWALAHYGRYPAGIEATTDPGKTIVVPRGGTLSAICDLPVAALRMADGTIEMLGQLGIVRIGQLAALPRDGVSLRFGMDCLRRLDQACGAVDEPVATLSRLPEFVVDWSLEYPTDRRETIYGILDRLVARLAAALSQQGCGALQLVCRLTVESAPAVTLQVGLFRPSATAAHLLELLQMQVERTPLAGMISAVAVQAPRFGPLGCRQQELFASETTRPDTHALAVLIDRLAGRLGRAAVVRPRIGADAQPELAWRAEPLVGPPRPARRKRTPPLPPPARRPLLLQQPIPLSAVVTTTAMPQSFRLGNHNHRVARAWGPERIETGWWRRRGIRRDYHRVETVEGCRFWIYRQLDDGRWFCQGEFG